MRSHLQVLRQVWEAPGNRPNRLGSLCRAARWFAKCRWGDTEPHVQSIFSGGWAFPCYPDSIVAKHVMYRSEWYDWDLMHFMEGFLRPGDHYLDVGANIGLHTLTAARSILRPPPSPQLDPSSEPPLPDLAGREIERLAVLCEDLENPAHLRERRIFAVEPHPGNLARLRHCLGLNRLETEVVVLPVAAADHHGTMRLEGDDVFSRIRDADAAAPGVEVRVERLEDLLPMVMFQFVKLDVEGAEWQALRGLERHIREGLLPVLALELIGHAKVYDLEEDDLIAWLEGLGYRLALYRHDEKRLDFEARPFGDVLAINAAGRELIAKRMHL